MGCLESETSMLEMFINKYNSRNQKFIHVYIAELLMYIYLHVDKPTTSENLVSEFKINLLFRRGVLLKFEKIS